MDASPKKRQKVEHVQSSESKTNSKQIRIPTYDRTKHSEAESIMKSLRLKWNLLDQKRGSKERSDYIEDMQSEIGGWLNPDGEDERERFSKMFFQLFPSEQKHFLSMCFKSEVPYNRDIPEDVIEWHFKCRQTPFYVDGNLLEEKSNESSNYRDGSEKYPFHSIEEAEAADEYSRNLHVKCTSSCIKKKCPHPKCERDVCLEHGNGIMTYHDYKECYMPQLSEICFDCRTIICEEHSEKLLRECESCSRRVSIERCVGEYHGVDSCDQGPSRMNYLCRSKCGEICGKIDDENEDYEEEDEERPFWDYDMPRVGRCHLLCCKECLEEDHDCFNDPREYL
ncbi:predicted protein [Chaetoceros tenuissimus]|uniref:Uncharacterized protein n=1 Tax=Chaetoceros tenuissimus TaxID=426638 RepID=A0AAD3CK40_9STRA|nr:predicted protein [Chaetoceros tenuissimus]